MSNFHTPKSGVVLRRESGRADRVSREAPELGVDYNDKMGGTDLMDFIRGLYTTQRKSKKWWRYLYHWVMDTTLFNVWVLYQWVWKFIKGPGDKLKMRYRDFILEVVGHYIPGLQSTLEGDHYLTPVVTKRHRKTPRPSPFSFSPASASTVYTGETRRPPKWLNPCPGSDLRRSSERDNRDT